MSINYYFYSKNHVMVNSLNIRCEKKLAAEIDRQEQEKFAQLQCAGEKYTGKKGYIALNKSIYGDLFKYAGVFRLDLHSLPAPPFDYPYMIDLNLGGIFKLYDIQANATPEQMAKLAYELHLTQPFYNTTEFTSCAYISLKTGIKLPDKRKIREAAKYISKNENLDPLILIFREAQQAVVEH